MEITNEMKKQKQVELDQIKWRQSQIAKIDLSGKYEYCRYCEYCNLDKTTCCLSQADKERLSACGESWYEMKNKK